MGPGGMRYGGYCGGWRMREKLDKVNVEDLLCLADQMAFQLLNRMQNCGWTAEEAYQTAVMTAQLLARVQPNPKRTVEAALEAQAMLKLLTGDGLKAN